MTSFLKYAKSVHDVEADISCVEAVYERYTADQGYLIHTDYLHTEPTTDWTYIQSRKPVQYDKFLDTMVDKTLDVRRRLAELALDTLFSWDQENIVYVRVAHAMKILDPTFQPPYVNMTCAWQMDIMRTLCKGVHHAIQVCTDTSRLDYFLKVVRLIALEQ